MHSPLTIFSWILAGIGDNVSWRSDGVCSNVGTAVGLTFVEELVGRTVVGRGESDRTCKEAADRQSSSIASAVGSLNVWHLHPYYC